MEKAIAALISLGTEPKLAEDSVRKILRDNKLDNSTDILMQALDLIEKKKKHQEKHKSRKEAESINKLEKAIEKGKRKKKSAHEILLEEGFIMPPLKEFVI